MEFLFHSQLWSPRVERCRNKPRTVNAKYTNMIKQQTNAMGARSVRLPVRHLPCSLPGVTYMHGQIEQFLCPRRRELFLKVPVPCVAESSSCLAAVGQQWLFATRATDHLDHKSALRAMWCTNSLLLLYRLHIVHTAGSSESSQVPYHLSKYAFPTQPQPHPPPRRQQGSIHNQLSPPLSHRLQVRCCRTPEDRCSCACCRLQ